jgi:hypothetical protein
MPSALQQPRGSLSHRCSPPHCELHVQRSFGLALRQRMVVEAAETIKDCGHRASSDTMSGRWTPRYEAMGQSS